MTGCAGEEHQPLCNGGLWISANERANEGGRGGMAGGEEGGEEPLQHAEQSSVLLHSSLSSAISALLAVERRRPSQRVRTTPTTLYATTQAGEKRTSSTRTPPQCVCLPYRPTKERRERSALPHHSSIRRCRGSSPVRESISLSLLPRPPLRRQGRHSKVAERLRRRCNSTQAVAAGKRGKKRRARGGRRKGGERSGRRGG